MTPLHIIFYLFSAVAIGSASMVIISRNPVRAVLFLILTFFSMAGVWIILHAEFLALILVLVYVGAVMTLFLFVVMMINIDIESMKKGFVNYLPLIALISLAIMALIAMTIGPKVFGLQTLPEPKAASYSNIAELGQVLYTNYVLPFEIAAVILLTAIVAAISLAHRKPMHRKSQDPAKQINIRREDRIKLIKMPSQPMQEKTHDIAE